MMQDQDETGDNENNYNEHVLHEQFVHEQLVLEVDRERLHCSSSLQQDEQRTYELESEQMNDDMLAHDDAIIKRTIQEIERLHHSSDSSICQSDANWTNCNWYHAPTDSSENDLNENTDIDDGITDLIEVVGANTNLIAFLQKQRATIARLRARIVRLNFLLAQQILQTDHARQDCYSAQ